MIPRGRGAYFVSTEIAALLFVTLLQMPVAASERDLARGAVRTSVQSAKQPARRVISAFEGASTLDGLPAVVVHEQVLGEVNLRPGEVVLARLPLAAGRFLILELEPLRVLGPQTRIVMGGLDGVDVPIPYDSTEIHLFRGKAQGFPDSRVVLFSSPRGIRGNIDLGPKEQRYLLSSVGAAGQDATPGLAVVRPVSRGGETLPDVPMCGIQSSSVVAGCCPEPPSDTIYSKRTKSVEIAVETDYDLYENFNDPTATMDYVVELFARTNAIFLQEIDTRFEVVFVRLFSTAASEKPFMNNSDPLSGYVNYWNANEGAIARDTGTFITGRRNLPYGGVAYLGGVCTSFGYNVCGYMSGFPDPTRPNAGDYDTGVLAHELGHNFDACHTPDYCPFVDRCYPPPVFPQRGTLMSYCSQTVSGGNLTEELWYHRRLRRVMRGFIEAGASCISYDCNQNGIDDTADIAGGTPDVNGNGIPDVCEDCQPNGILDGAEIAADPSLDDNANGIPDECEPDCNGNGKPDDLDIALGTSPDLWGNGVPDECDPDCDGDGIPDYDEIQLDLTLDLDRNVVLDACQDCDGDGINDIVELQGARHAWVASDVLDYIGQYHALSGVRVKTSTTGEAVSAQDLIIAPGNRVLVTAATTNKVVAFDAVSGAYLNDFVSAGSGGLSYPTGLIMGPDGHLLVCSRNTNNVLKYDGATGAFLGEFVAGGSGGLTIPFGLVYGPSGNLYVSSGGNQVLEYDGGSGAFIRVFVSSANNGGLSGARGMAFKPDGNLLAASYNTDAIIQYNGSTGASMGKWNSGGTASALYLDGPWGLRIGLNGNVFASRDLPATEFEENHHDHDGDHDLGEVEGLHVTSARIMEFDVLNGKYTRSYVVGDDTGLRSTTGFAFMPNLFAIDCNENLLQDDCDLSTGHSADANFNGIPDECDPTKPVGGPGGKNRSVSLQVPPSAIAGPGAVTALRVTLVDLQNPQPPNLGCCPPPDFSPYETGATCTDPGGCVRWVGKPGIFLESQEDPGMGSYVAARLQCTPLYRDWTADGELHIIGAEIVPSSTYHVQNFGESCRGNEAACGVASEFLAVTTGRWGDIAAAFNPPSTTTQPDAIDVTRLVDKFKSVSGAPSKAVSQIQPNLPEPNADISALDIVAAVDAVKQSAYPYSGPCPCPSIVICNMAACASPADCGGDDCVMTCVGGANSGDPCINNSHCPGGTCGTGFCRDRCGRCSP